MRTPGRIVRAARLGLKRDRRARERTNEYWDKSLCGSWARGSSSKRWRGAEEGGEEEDGGEGEGHAVVPPEGEQKIGGALDGKGDGEGGKDGDGEAAEEPVEPEEGEDREECGEVKVGIPGDAEEGVGELDAEVEAGGRGGGEVEVGALAEVLAPAEVQDEVEVVAAELVAAEVEDKPGEEEADRDQGWGRVLQRREGDAGEDEESGGEDHHGDRERCEEGASVFRVEHACG